MNILLCGIGGHMGREVLALSARAYRNACVSVGVDPSAPIADCPVYTSFADVPHDAPIDCILDFSHHSAIPELLTFAVQRHLPTVVATTGHTEEELTMIEDAAKSIPVFFSANMSLGVALLVELAKQAAAAMPDAEIEIIEKHHDRKVDAPSGTALMLADAIREIRPELYTHVGRNGYGKRDKHEIGIHAIRIGNVIGEHEILLATQSQTITLKHEAHSRALFAEGAIAAASHIIDADVGMYNMYTLLRGVHSTAVLS